MQVLLELPHLYNGTKLLYSHVKLNFTIYIIAVLFMNISCW